MSDSVPTQGQKLRALREKKGLSRRELAAMVGAHHNTIQKLENDERKLSLDWIKKLAPHLGVAIGDFLGVPPTLKQLEQESETVNRRETLPAPSNVYSPEKWPRDLPVMGVVECGPDGWSLWNGEIIQMAPRPPSVAGVTKAYAVYAAGDSMEHRYFAGELIFVNPAKPVEPGSFVLVQVRPEHEGDPPRALLKRLVRRSGSKVILEQFNPPKRIELRASDIVSIHRVVGTGEG